MARWKLNAKVKTKCQIKPMKTWGIMPLHVRVRNTIKFPLRFTEADLIAFALSANESIEVDEPLSVSEARRSVDWKHWEKAIMEEMKALDCNDICTLFDKPKGKRISIASGFSRGSLVYSVEPPRYKARLVAKGIRKLKALTTMRYSIWW